MVLTKAPILAVLAFAAAPLAWAQAPRAGPGSGKAHPNLNGIWQAVNEANWDLEGHGARPSPVVAMGALGAAPGGLGVVDAGAIPYLPAALAQRKENFTKRMELDPEVKCYLPGVPRATYMPYPFQIVQSDKTIFIGYEDGPRGIGVFIADEDGLV